MDSFDFLKSLDAKHGKTKDYTPLVSIEDINKLSDLNKAEKAKADNSALVQTIKETKQTENEQPKKNVNQPQVTTTLKLEEIVISNEKALDKSDKNENER